MGGGTLGHGATTMKDYQVFVCVSLHTPSPGWEGAVMIGIGVSKHQPATGCKMSLDIGQQMLQATSCVGPASVRVSPGCLLRATDATCVLIPAIIALSHSTSTN